MECLCEVGVYDDGEYSETLSRVQPTARKQHRCSECFRAIQKDEQYEYYKGVYEGDVFIHKTCIDCLSIRNTFFKKGYCFESIVYEFNEFIRESGGQIAEECLAALTPKARERACNEIDEIWYNYWMEGPTQPAERFSILERKLGFLNVPSWMKNRWEDIYKMDKVILGGL